MSILSYELKALIINNLIREHYSIDICLPPRVAGVILTYQNNSTNLVLKFVCRSWMVQDSLNVLDCVKNNQECKNPIIFNVFNNYDKIYWNNNLKQFYLHADSYELILSKLLTKPILTILQTCIFLPGPDGLPNREINVERLKQLKNSLLPSGEFS